MSNTGITFDEFADAETIKEAFEEAHDEWIDRDGVDRSADAEGKRIDDAYERMVQQQLIDGLDRTPSCKWCQLPNGHHHPECSSGVIERGVTAAEILKFKQEYEINFVKPAHQTTTEELAIAMEAEVLKSIEEGMDGTDTINYNTESMIWKIDSGTEVFVSDNKGVLRGHRMKKDAVYSDIQIMVVRDNQGKGLSEVPATFVYPELCGQKLSTNLKTLVDGGWIVIETGLKRWPFLIMRQKHAIVVYASLEGYVGRSGGTCRKLGY